MTALISLTPAEVAERLKAGQAVLVDIRAPDDFAAGHTPGAISRPLDSLSGHLPHTSHGHSVIFTCRTGMRTGSNCDRLAGHVDGPAFVLAGGLDAWRAAGLPVTQAHRGPIEVIRQVHLSAGLLTLTGVLLGWLVSPAFFLLSAVVGVGLTYAGASGQCLMAKALHRAPWNRPPAAV